jgi:hypothetical protein
MILIINKENMRLCYDNIWRAFANFGSLSSCVKIYKSLGHAKRRAKRNGGSVVEIPDGLTIDASGDVMDGNTHYTINSFANSKSRL